MRAEIEALLTGSRSIVAPAHAGLAYELWRPLNPKKDPNADTKRAQADEQQRWIEWVERARVPRDYPAAYRRWANSLAKDGSRAAEAKLSSRMLVGHGNHSPTEVGITLHHTWGVPMIPATALKGLLAAYVQVNFGPEDASLHPLQPEHPDAGRALWQGVRWDGRRIMDGPGPAYRLLFGAPRAASDPDHGNQSLADLPEPVSTWIEQQLDGGLEAASGPSGWAAWLVGERKGLVTFHDALLVPDPERMGSPFLVHDVLTVHQRTYYAGEGMEWPNDYDAPNPVSFLTVTPGLRFLFALSGPPAWTALALRLLGAALSDWGIGGKTTSGYGRFDRPFKEVASPERLQLAENTDLQTFLSWIEPYVLKLKSGEVTQKQFLEAVEREWVERLRALDDTAKGEVKKRIFDLISSKKQKGKRDEIWARVQG